MGKFCGRTVATPRLKQPVYGKNTSDLKPDKLRVKPDLVQLHARLKGLVNALNTIKFFF